MKRSLTLSISFFPLVCCLFFCCSSSTVQPAPETDDEQRDAFAAELTQLIQEEDFDKLEGIADEITVHKSRFPGGDWKLDRFYENVANPPGGYQTPDVDWPAKIAKLKKWTEHKPDSIYANIALAEAQIGYAWKTRGRGFANKVTDKGWIGFSEGLKEAEATLGKLADKRKTCVAWYRAMQSIGLGLGWDLDRMKELVEEAVTVEPVYYDVYEGHALFLLPRWYGSPGDWEAFADEASRKIGGIEGSILYSEICWQMSRYYQPVEFFKENNVSWPRIKEGFIAREKQYGSSVRYMNAFCLLSGSAADKPTTRILMRRIGDRWEPDFWKERKYFDSYKKWAFE